ncbi:hypothetical protein F5146DRAFT_1120852 [Armillaria mellea]|nr:hypothetical protein F5146DRAFT_1120852 [Armillaria mellea]
MTTEAEMHEWVRFADAMMDNNLLPVLRLSRQLISRTFEWNEPSKESDATMKSLFFEMSKTVCVGDALHHTLLPCLEFLEFDFALMIASRMLHLLRIDVRGRRVQLPFTDNFGFGLKTLKRLRDDGLELRLHLRDWEENALRPLSDSEDD